MANRPWWPSGHIRDCNFKWQRLRSQVQISLKACDYMVPMDPLYSVLKDLVSIAQSQKLCCYSNSRVPGDTSLAIQWGSEI